MSAKRSLDVLPGPLKKKVSKDLKFTKSSYKLTKWVTLYIQSYKKKIKAGISILSWWCTNQWQFKCYWNESSAKPRYHSDEPNNCLWYSLSSDRNIYRTTHYSTPFLYCQVFIHLFKSSKDPEGPPNDTEESSHLCKCIFQLGSCGKGEVCVEY